MKKMRLLTLSTVFPSLGTVSAAPNPNCHDLTIAVTISARNGVFNVPPTQSNIDATNFILNLTQQGHNYSQSVLTGYATIAGTYGIAATYVSVSFSCRAQWQVSRA